MGRELVGEVVNRRVGAEYIGQEVGGKKSGGGIRREIRQEY